MSKNKKITDHHLLVQKNLKCCSSTGGYGYMLKNNLTFNSNLKVKLIYIHDTTIKVL